MAGRFWDKNALRDLKRMYLDPDKDIEEMAESLNRTENAIRLKASRLGLKRPFMERNEECFGRGFDPEKCLTRPLSKKPGPCPDWLLCCNAFYRENYLREINENG